MSKILKIFLIIFFLNFFLDLYAYEYNSLLRFRQLLGKLEPNKEYILKLVYKNTSPRFPDNVKEVTFELEADERPFYIHVLTYHEKQADVLGRSVSFISFWEKVEEGYICRGSKEFKMYDIEVHTNKDTIIVSGKKEGFADEFLHYAFKVSFSKLFYYYIIELQNKPKIEEPYRIDRSKENFKATKPLPIEGSTRKSKPILSENDSNSYKNIISSTDNNSFEISKNDNKSNKIAKKERRVDDDPIKSIISDRKVQKDTVHYLYKWNEYMKEISIDMHEPLY